MFKIYDFNKYVEFATLEEADAFCDENFLRKPSRALPPKPEPILVTVKVNQQDPTKRYGFIGRQKCYFENDGVALVEGTTVPVMITRPFYGKTPDGRRDPTNIIAVFVRPTDTDEYALVRHTGFECSGSMCATTASLADENGKSIGGLITPGRSEIRVADNVSAGRTWQRKFTALQPGWVYVNNDKLIGGDTLRVEGLASLDEANYFQYIRL